MARLFLLSPARVDGVRAAQLLNPTAPFPLARKFRTSGASLGELFTFASGLYFRGKLTYARAFARPERGDLIRVITTNRGLLDPELMVTPADLRAFGAVAIDEENEEYHRPLRRDACTLAAELGSRGKAILLGSIATAKYRDVLLDCLGERLHFPPDFVGRGDMSRGALLLRAAAAGRELPYAPVAGATYSGRRAPRVGPPQPLHRRR